MSRGAALLLVAAIVACDAAESVSALGAPEAGSSGAPWPDGRCVKLCAAPKDCCFTDLCTGYGYVCDDGLCAKDVCSTNEQCQAEGQFPTRDCLITGGAPRCEFTCAADSDCSGLGVVFADWVCTGHADDGTPVCRTAEPKPDCYDGKLDQCLEGGSCQGGRCVCTTASDCAAEGDAAWVCIHPPARP